MQALVSRTQASNLSTQLSHQRQELQQTVAHLQTINNLRHQADEDKQKAIANLKEALDTQT